MRRVLIATPERSLIAKHYVVSAMEVTALFAGNKDIHFDIQFCSGTSVNFARNDLAHHAVQNDYDDLVFIDSDMGKWTQQLLRLLDHNLPIVGGLYVSKSLTATPWVTPYPDCRPDPETGLLRVAKIATGFLRIKVKEVFPALQKAYPESAYMKKDDAAIHYEYFPMGVLGPGSFENKIQAIKKVMDSDMHLGTSMETIASILAQDYPGNILGEDYYFCHRCVEAGIPIYADTKLLIPHFDMSTEYPADPAKIIALAERLKAKQ